MTKGSSCRQTDALAGQGAPVYPGASAPGRTGQLRDTSDTDLLELCRHGNAEAWDTLVRRYESLVYSVALRNGLSPEDAADVTQTTFVALLESITRLRTDQSLASWLMTVSRRQAWRQRRRRQHEQPSSTTVSDPADPIGGWERVAVVQDALRRLGGPCRELLFALYFDPLTPSYAETAQRMGRSVGGIGPMRARCLQQMRALLGEDVNL